MCPRFMPFFLALFFAFFIPPAFGSALHPVDQLGTGMIRFYQRVLSSQDGANCPMRPTCSEFTLQAIQRYGLVQGILMGADRLLRDNPWSHDYPIGGTGERIFLVDPVEEHVLWPDVHF